MGKKWMILLCSFSVLTLISSILSSTLVYYSEQARTDINSNTVVATNNVYKSLSVNYEQNNNISLSNLDPGDKITQSFSIINNNSNTIKYAIVWDNTNSTWNVGENYQEAHPEEFTYYLSCTNGEKIEKQMPLTKDDYEIIDNLELKTNKTNDCTISFEFKSNGQDQSYNYNKSFGGTYKVVVKE